MSHSIFIDQDRNAAILVNDDPIFALGPIIVADDPAEAAEALEGFLGALGDPPEQMPTIRLMTEWQGFLMALHGTILGDPEAAPPAGSPAPMGLDDESPTEGVSGPETAGESPEPAEETDIGPGPEADAVSHEPRPIPDDDHDDDDDQELVDVDPDELHQRIGNVPGGTPAQRGQVECWACGGVGHVDIAGEQQSCQLCGGTGRLAAAS